MIKKECSFSGSVLQGRINGIIYDNCNGTVEDRLLHILNGSKFALRTQPKSKYWKDAVEYIEERLRRRGAR